jgi:hypothetical protein
MPQPLVSILLPHLHEPENDKALRICLDCIIANTGLNFELIMESVAERRDIYRVINSMAARANAYWLIPMNSDVFVSPGWLEPIYEARDLNAIVSPCMVEPGAIGVNERNIHKDFGMRPETFRRSEFEAWVAAGGDWSINWLEGEWAWFYPSLISQSSFLTVMGGFDTKKGSFPDPIDIDFWNRWEVNGGKFKRVRSWVYHLQNYSNPDEQKKAVRHA